MFLFRSLTALSVAAVMTLSGASADAQQAKKKKKQLTVKGVVVAVHHAGKVGEHDYLTVKIGTKKQGGAAKEEKIHVGPNTKFVKLIGKKKQGPGQTSSPASFADVHRGEHVIVTLHAGRGHQAERVAINTARKKKQAVSAR
jgi:hypothetical protein